MLEEFHEYLFDESNQQQYQTQQSAVPSKSTDLVVRH
jgi:hypothetical protein